MKKKNRSLRVATGLAVAAMLSMCLVSGTFAKYTTSGDSTDTARVAKFGVTVAGTDGSMFAKAYDNTVQSGDEWNVVAPGTKGQLTAVALSGTPEVNVKVTNEATVSLTNWTVDGAYYCPLEVKVGTTTLKGADYTSAAQFEAAIKAAVDGTAATYDAGTDLSAKTDARPAISWEWKYEGAQGGAQTDENDTKLGDAAAADNTANKDNTPKVNISVTTTVTQVD